VGAGFLLVSGDGLERPQCKSPFAKPEKIILGNYYLPKWEKNEVSQITERNLSLKSHLSKEKTRGTWGVIKPTHETRQTPKTPE